MKLKQQKKNATNDNKQLIFFDSLENENFSRIANTHTHKQAAKAIMR